jgi:hypothetical protein
MHEQHGLGLLPGIGVVVDGVENVAAVGAFEGVFHVKPYKNINKNNIVATEVTEKNQYMGGSMQYGF